MDQRSSSWKAKVRESLRRDRGTNSTITSTVVFLLVLYGLNSAVQLSWPGYGAVQAILGFILLTFIPGALILGSFDIDLDRPERVVYIIIISTVSIMLLGAFTSAIYLANPSIFPEPIRPRPFKLLVISFVFLLCVIFYSSNNNPEIPEPISFTRMNLFLILLPVCGVLGASYINWYGLNIVSLSTLLLVSLTPLAVILAKYRNYPLAVLSTSLTILLQNSTIITQLIQGDATKEFEIAYHVLNTGFWDPQLARGSNQMLRVSVLHPAYSTVMDLPLFWEFKIVHPLLFGFTGVVVYCLARRCLSRHYAYLCATMYVFIHPFFNLLSRNTRTGLAILFTAVFVLTLIDRTLPRRARSVILVSSSVGLIFSHYGTAPILLVVLITAYFTEKIYAYRMENGRTQRIRITPIVLFGVLLLVWYIYTASGSNFQLIVGVIYDAVNSLVSTGSSSESSAGSAFGIPMPSFTFAFIWMGYILMSILSALGIIFIAFKYIATWIRKKPAERISAYSGRVCVSSTLFFLGIGAGSIFAAAFGPFGMGIARVYTIGMLFVLPFGFIWLAALASILSDRKVLVTAASVMALLILVHSGFVAATVTHGVSPQPNLDREWTEKHGSEVELFYLYRYYIPQSDVTQTSWLVEHGNPTRSILSPQTPGRITRTVKGGQTPIEEKFEISYANIQPCGRGDYLYLSKGVMKIGEIPDASSLRFVYYDNAIPLSNFRRSHTIYDNGGEIRICTDPSPKP